MTRYGLIYDFKKFNNIKRVLIICLLILEKVFAFKDFFIHIEYLPSSPLIKATSLFIFIHRFLFRFDYIINFTHAKTNYVIHE